MKLIIPALLIAFFFNSCCESKYDKKDFEFAPDELAHLSAYNKNETIYFKSNKQDIDTLVILKTEERLYRKKCPLSRRPYHEMDVYVDDVSGFGYSHDGRVDTMYKSLIFLSKKPPEKTSVWISYKNFHWHTDSTFGEFHKNLTLNGRLIEDCYVLKMDTANYGHIPLDIIEVYWTDKYGLTAYTSADGETWLRK